MNYKCIKGFSVEKCDDDGFTINGEYFEVVEGSIWINQEDAWRLIGGEIRLECDDDGGWIEISEGTFKKHFQAVN